EARAGDKSHGKPKRDRLHSRVLSLRSGGSFHFRNVDAMNDPAPARNLGLDPGRELVPRACDRLEAERAETLANLGLGQGFDDLAMQALGDIVWRFRTHHHACDDIDLAAGDAG